VSLVPRSRADLPRAAGPGQGSRRGAQLRGFIAYDHPGREPDSLRDVSGWLKEGKPEYPEHIVKGLENPPRAFRGLSRAEVFGERVVQAGDDPTRAGE
jgi:NADPH-dependent curcumin reductase CurA